MRIIPAKFKGREIFVGPGRSTRPRTSYKRQVISCAYQEFALWRILLLFSATRSFGLEALSRGAVWVDFVEFASPAIGTCLKNISKLGCSDMCHIYRKRADSFLSECTAQYDIIFLDPPYEKGLINQTLGAIFCVNILAPNGIIIVEHSKYEPINEEFQQYIIKQKLGKLTAFSWLGTAEI